MATMRTALVVDDETGVLVLCQQLLEAASFQVHTAVDTEEALFQLASYPFDLLLTDLRLPGMDGFELMVRARALQPEIAVVVLTGYRTVEMAIQALREDVDGIVFKPNEIGPELVQIVQRSLDENRKKHPVVDLHTLPALLQVGGLSLLETTPAQAEKMVVRSILETFQATHAGIYQRSASSGDFRLLSSAGTLPENGDPFWQNASVAPAFTEDTRVRLLPGSQNTDLNPISKDWGGSGVLVVSTRRKKDHYLIIVVRDTRMPVFQETHLDLLVLFARQAAITLENTRLFHGLAAMAHKMEGAGGLLPEAARMAMLDDLLPAASAEINNPLQSLKNNLYLSSRRDLTADRLAGSLEMAQKELYRLEGNLQRMLTLLGPSETERSSLDIESLVARVVEAFQPLLREKGIQTRVAAARPLPAVCASRAALEQSLAHVLMNAVEAMESNPAEKLIYIDVDHQPGGLLVAIEDSGEGIAPEAEEIIFKPFYTTRPDHMGIGLMVCQHYLEGEGGRLVLKSPLRTAGSRFEIYLPVGG